jgi:hypothetical protein
MILQLKLDKTKKPVRNKKLTGFFFFNPFNWFYTVFTTFLHSFYTHLLNVKAFLLFSFLFMFSTFKEFFRSLFAVMIFLVAVYSQLRFDLKQLLKLVDDWIIKKYMKG